MKTNETISRAGVPACDVHCVQVRLLEENELERFNELLEQQHYLGNARLVGEQMRYVAHIGEDWVGLLGWHAGSFNLKDREKWIGWSHAQRRERLPLVVNNSRFLLLGKPAAPNLASKILSLCTTRLSSDWESRYGHGVLIAETFVDPQLYRGASYSSSGWILLGQTRGFRRDRKDFYQEHDRPKQLWVKELQAGALTVLRGKNRPQALRNRKPSNCTEDEETLEKMFLFFNGMPEFRKGKSKYPLASLVAIAVCACLCGVVHGQRDLAAFAENLTLQQRKALHLPRLGRKRYAKVCAPKETTFFRLLSQLDSCALEKALLDWQNHVVGPPLKKGDWIAYDGKELRHSQGTKIVSAYSVKTGHWLGSELVQEDSNEIPAVQKLLRRVSMEGNIFLADAMHTQASTAHQIVQEQGGDYLLTVKGNQKTVRQNVQQLYQGLQNVFSPSGGCQHRPDRGNQQIPP